MGPPRLSASSRRTLWRASAVLLLIPVFLMLRPAPDDAAGTAGTAGTARTARTPGTAGAAGAARGASVNERAHAVGSGLRGGLSGLGSGIGQLGQLVGGGRGGAAAGAGDDEDAVWLDLDEDMPWTTYDGGLPGYTVFSNLYLSRGALLAVTPSAADAAGAGEARARAAIPEPRAVMSGERAAGGGVPAAGEDRWREVRGREMARDELGKVAIRLPGVTYIFNDMPGPAGYLVYFKHFALEVFVGATRALASALAALDPGMETVPLARRLWFPRCSARPGWRDEAGLNAWFLAHALPAAVVEDADAWTDRESTGLSYVLDHVVIVDRWSAHSVGGEVGRWGKMNANIPTLSAPPLFWDSIRTSVMRSLGVHGPSAVGKHGLPVVVLIDQDLSATARAGAIDALKGLTARAEVHVTKFGSMGRPQQVEFASRAQVLIGTHNELMQTALWMRATPGATVIEIFADGAFARDHEILATALGLRYIALHPGKVLDEEAWRALGRQESKEPEIELDPALLVRVVGEVLDEIPWH